MSPAGTVTALFRYPVKSMAAEPLERADLHWTWLHGDRQYAFLRTDDTSDFPWLTARQLPDLLRHGARYPDPANPDRGTPTVTTPDGAEYDVRDPALAARLAGALGAPLQLLRLGRGAYDGMPVSILATTTPPCIARHHGRPVAAARFRPNLLIEPDDPATTERDWIGRTLGIGAEARLHVDWPTRRCAVIALDPASAARDPTLLRTVARQFGNEAGAYCAVANPGTIHRGDRVHLL